VITLDDRVEKCVLRRDADFARVDLHVLHILLVDLFPIVGEHDAAAIVEALDVRAGDPDVNAANHDVAFLSASTDRFVNAFHGGLEIDDLAFAHPARRSLANPENLHRAVGSSFADHDADFRGPDLETDHQVAASHWGCLPG
jgi:hypothetical protein